MSTPKKNLVAVRDLLSDPKRWTKNAVARNSAGQVTEVLGSSATCFCLMGAIQRVTDLDYRMEVDAATLIYAEQIRRNNEGVGITLFNDNAFTTHKDVINLLDAAIANAP